MMIQLDPEKNHELARRFRDWLHIEEKYINASLWEVLEKLDRSWLQNKMEQARLFCNLSLDLLQAQRTLSDPQVNLSYVEGVLNAYRGAIHWTNGTLDSAEVFFRRSAQHFADSGVGHYNASVVQMALGEVLERQGRLHEALKAYQQSLHRSEHWSAPKPKSLRRAVLEKFNRTCQKLCPGMTAEPDSFNSTRTNNPRSAKSKSCKLQVFPIMELASAGAPQLLPNGIEGYGAIETIKIDGTLCEIHPLQTDEDIQLRLQVSYIISPVKGNSMDLAGIQDGDYVFLEKPLGGSPKPKDGDIVLAVISDEVGSENSGATLKKYRKEDGDEWLEPDSSDKSHQSILISKQGKPSGDRSRIEIVAIAIAVLKEIIDRGLP